MSAIPSLGQPTSWAIQSRARRTHSGWRKFELFYRRIWRVSATPASHDKFSTGPALASVAEQPLLIPNRPVGLPAHSLGPDLNRGAGRTTCRHEQQCSASDKSGFANPSEQHYFRRRFTVSPPARLGKKVRKSPVRRDAKRQKLGGFSPQAMPTLAVGWREVRSGSRQARCRRFDP